MDVTRFPLFSGLTEEDAEELRRGTVERRFPAGARVFSQGEPASGFCLLRSGKVKIYRVSPSGAEQVIHVALPGQSFAEAAVFHGGGYPASAECLAPSEVLFVRRDTVVSLVRSHPDFALRMMAGMARKMRGLVDLVEDLTLRDARGRLCRYIAGLVPPGSQESLTVRLPVRQVLLARHLGVAGETLSRTIRSLSQERILEMEGRGRVRVHDVPALREAAGA